jgi:type II secretion system protein I
MDGRAATTAYNNLKKSRSAFTLIEVLVATVIVAIAIVGVLGGISSITSTKSSALDAAFLQRLANEKLNDLRMLQDPTTAGSTGDFSDRGYPDITWSSDVETTSTTNLDQVSVTATRGNRSQEISTLIYVLPAAGTVTGTGTTSGTAVSTP